MNALLRKLSSRKFLTALAVQVVAVIAIFYPEQESQFTDAAMRIVGLVVLLLAALGYGTIEAAVDKAAMNDHVVAYGQDEQAGDAGKPVPREPS